MSPRGTPIGPVRLGVSAVLIGAGAVVVADQTKLTATRALTGGFFIKPGLSAAFQYGGIALVGLGALLIVIGALANADPGAVATLRRATVTLEVLVVLVGVLVYLGYRHAKDQQQQPAQSVATTDTTTTDTTPSTTTPTPVPFVINCNLDSSGKPTSTCSYPDGPPPAAAGTTTPPPPGKDPLTANCTDLGPNAAHAVELYRCTSSTG